MNEDFWLLLALEKAALSPCARLLRSAKCKAI